MLMLYHILHDVRHKQLWENDNREEKLYILMTFCNLQDYVTESLQATFYVWDRVLHKNDDMCLDYYKDTVKKFIREVHWKILSVA
jgi:hypothetical protein